MPPALPSSNPSSAFLSRSPALPARPISDFRPSTQDQRRLTSANRFLTIIGSSYGLDVALLAAFASIDTVNLTAPILHAVAGLSHVLIFWAINRSRWFALLSDSRITFAQMLSGLITHLTMTARQTWPILVCALACLAFLVIGLHGRPAFPVDNLSERLLTLTFFTICLGRSLLLGTIGSRQPA